MKPKIIVVVGQTTTGKSDCAVVIARAYQGEIISADSRQVYRGLTIGTGKITKKEMRGIPHHLLDIADPKKQYTVTTYVAEAEKVLQDIIARKKLPIIVGGTGFYIDALTSNTKLPEVPPDLELRARLTGKSAAELYTMLTWLDKNRAETIDAQNPRRLIRAIEIAKHYGSVPPLSPNESRYDILWIGLKLSPDILRKKIHDRLHIRMKKGMLREAQKLHQHGLSWKRMHELGLEYRFLALYLQKKITKEVLYTQLETAIYHYAKRQMTWFKKHTAITWFDPSETTRILDTVHSFLQRP